MRRGAYILMSTALIGAVGGCTTTGANGPLWTARERGYDIAQRRCFSCHTDLGPTGPMGAPPFVDIGRRYNALSFERRLREIAAGRHDLMPPLQLSPDEAADLAAYIAALGFRPAPCNPVPEDKSCTR